MPSITPTAINFVAATCANITCYAKDSLIFTITVTDGNGNPIDVTGYLFKLEVKSRGISPDALLSFSSSDNTIIIGGADNNVIQFQQNANIAGGSYVYDLISYSDNVETAWMYGKFVVIQNVTDNTFIS